MDAHRAGTEDGSLGNMLGHLMANSELDDEVLKSEVIAFVFAGYDTTASLLTSFFACMGVRQDIYEEVRDEALALPEFSYASMQGQRLMDAAWLETARLHPPLTFNMRGVVRDIEFQGFEIRAGSKVAYSPWYTGRMPELFDAPDDFRPERFLSGRDKIPKWAVLAFGGGQRPCIGKRFANLEMRLFANMLMKRWDLEFIEGQSDAMFFNPAMQRAHGYKVRLRKRGHRFGRAKGNLELELASAE
jgi:cytochrome P450